MNEKLAFIQTTFPAMLEQLAEDAQPVFGKMNPHQMIEHMAWAFQIASGKLHFENTQSRELTEKMHRFIMSEKLFRDNTPNSNLPDNPTPAITNDITEAIQLLLAEIEYFIDKYKQDAELRIENPFFGKLNFEEQIHLLHKHAMHHLRQFNVIPL